MKEPLRKSDLPVALVLGAKVMKGGKASAALSRRAEHAVMLWQAGGLGAIICSGAERWHAPSEAVVIADICQAGGVPRDLMILEESAETTLQNLVFSIPLLDGLGARHVIIVTDSFHAPRVKLLAARLGLDATVSSPEPPNLPARVWIKSRAREACAYLWCLLGRQGQRRGNSR